MRGDLLDGASPEISVRVRRESLFVFSTLSGIGFPADAVHGDSESLVRLFADGTIRHGTGNKARDDFFRRFHFFDRNASRSFLELHESPEIEQAPALIVHQPGEFPEARSSSDRRTAC